MRPSSRNATTIGVTVLCPGLVRTRIYYSERNRPRPLVPQGGAAEEKPDLLTAAEAGIEPDAVAGMVRDAIADNRFYVLTTDAFDGVIRERTEKHPCPRKSRLRRSRGPSASSGAPMHPDMRS